MKKTSIILSGGGMKSSYTVGMMQAISEKVDKENIDIIISSSASAPTGAYYISDQMKDLRKFWESDVTLDGVVNMWRIWKVFDLKKVINVLLKGNNPLNEKRYKESRISHTVPVVSLKTGKMKYINAKKNGDIYKLLEDSETLPGFTLIPDGSEEEYCDSHATGFARIHLKKAIELGAEKVLIVTTVGSKFSIFWRDIYYNIWAFFKGKTFRKNYQRINKIKNKLIEHEGVEVFEIIPNPPLKIRLLENGKKVIKKSIKRGYDETIRNEKLFEFLNKD